MLKLFRSHRATTPGKRLREWTRRASLTAAAVLGSGALVLAAAAQQAGTIETEIWYGTRRMTPAAGGAANSATANRADGTPAHEFPAPSDQPAGQAPGRFELAPQSNPLRVLGAPSTEPPMRFGDASFDERTATEAPASPLAELEEWSHTDASSQDPASGTELGHVAPAIEMGSPHGAADEGVSQASLLRGAEPANVGHPPVADRQRARSDLADQHAQALSGAGPAEPQSSDSSWRGAAMAAALFLTGALLGPVVIGLVLARFLRRSGPLFRVEIVGLNTGAASLAWSSQPGAAAAEDHGEPANRRAGVSLEAPPLEIPVEETFVDRRRREQQCQSEQETQILQKLFEENLELRRQWEE